MFEMQEEIEKSRHGKMEKLGKYIQEYTVKNKCAESIPVYSVTNTQGFCKDYFGKEVASKDKTTYKIVPKGYFAYNPSRINVGSVDWQRNEERVIVSPLYNAFSVSEQLNQQYLYNYLKSDIVRQFIKAIARGTVRDNLKLSMLCEFPIYVPSVLEQENIVVKLDGLQKVINLRKQQLQKLDELIQARFVEMFGDPISNSLESNMLPMTDVCEIIDGDRGKNYPTQEEFNEKGYCLFLNAKNVTNVGFNFDKCMFITKQKDEILRKGKLCRGDVVLTTRGTIGNMAYYTEKIPFEHIRINSGMVILRMKHEIINEVFFIEQFKMQIANIKSKIASGSAQPQLPISTMNRIHILIPDINSQNQFADFVNQVNKSKLVIKNLLQIYKHQIQM